MSLRCLPAAAVAFCLLAGPALSVSAALPRGTLRPLPLAGYKVVDVGHPPHPAIYNWSAPVAFNNTGQMIGYADFGSYGLTLGTRCIAFTGTTFINLTPASDSTCVPLSVSDKIGATFKVVGYLSDEYSPAWTQAFVTSLTGSAVDADVFEDYPQSRLQEITAKGDRAVGASSYAPPSGYFSSGGPFVEAGGTFAVMQPQCTTVQQFCIDGPLQSGGGPFGTAGRAINASGTVIGNDQAVDEGAGIMEYTIGKPASGVDFPALTASSAPRLAQIAGIDDAGNIYTVVHDPATGHYRSYAYYVKTGKYVNNGTPQGTNCDYQALSVNGPGEVLGTGVCSGADGGFDFTWTLKGGMVIFQTWGVKPPPFSPEAINDLGDILISIPTTDGYGPDWGELVP